MDSPMPALDSVVASIREYGSLYYALIFAWTFLEGETCVILSGVAARMGALDPVALFLCAWSGALLGDQVYFLVGRRWGARILARFPRTEARVARALSFLEKHSTLFILTFRFVYGVRNISSLAIGMSSVCWRRFAVLNVLSAGIWAAAFTIGGYLAGEVLQELMDKGILHGAFLGLFVLSLIVAALVVHLQSPNKPGPSGEDRSQPLGADNEESE